LASEIVTLVNEPERITEMEMAGRKLARRDAAAATVELMEELSGKKLRSQI
jgi:UDP-N-acetylglucosamine:LPS N-acetylglucosamine transferase